MAKARSTAKVAAKKKPALTGGPTVTPNLRRRALQQLVARHGRPDEAHCAAFGELIDDTGRAELGAQTKGPGVLGEGVDWAITIDEAFRQYPAEVEEHYSRVRFTYFLAKLVDLSEAITAQEARRSGQGATRGTAADREAVAREARRRLVSKLRRYAGHRAAERQALTDATGQTGDVDALGRSIGKLAELGRAWLALEGISAQIQCASAGLTDKVIDAAVAAGEALAGAAAEATLAGRKRSADAPEVNLAEGSVLNEMEEAQGCFEDAHEATPLVPRLIPGPATRHVLGPKRAPKKGAAPPQPPPGGNGQPAAGG